MKTKRVYSTVDLKIDQQVIIGKCKEKTNIETIYTDSDILCDNGKLYDLKIHKVLVLN